MGGSIVELIVIFAIVGTAAVLGARTFYRMMTGKGKRQCCGCGLCTRTDAKKRGSGERFSANAQEKKEKR